MSLLFKMAGSLGLVFILGACSKTPPSIDDVMTKLGTSGVQVENIQKPGVNSSSLLPKTYKEHAVFSVPSVAPSGGQVFVCEAAKDCDVLFQYFDRLKALAGPYLYKSKDGLVVMQLNSGLSADEAKKLGNIVTGM